MSQRTSGGSVQVNLHAARDQSKVFYLAARRCNDFERLPSGHQRFLFVPSLVLYAFSIEVGLKALAMFEGSTPGRGHDLRRLVEKLTPRARAQIVAAIGEREARFESDLDLVKDVFEVWRYVHEDRPVETDLGFLQRFAAAVQEALNAIP